ncbi:MAG: hypothetical protein WAV04_03300 [Candidatus Microsaccharimonas sp.]
MYRNDIPLIPQDELAYKLGLTVPENDAHLFERVRTGSKPPSGWGTQISKPEYNPNEVFKELNIPLGLEQFFMRDFIDITGLKKLLTTIQAEDGDALLCFDYGKLWGLPQKGGHVCVFDRIENDTIYIIDPERNVPKYRNVSLGALFKAMNFHGDANSTGVWKIVPTDSSAK